MDKTIAPKKSLNEKFIEFQQVPMIKLLLTITKIFVLVTYPFLCFFIIVLLCDGSCTTKPNDGNPYPTGLILDDILDKIKINPTDEPSGDSEENLEETPTTPDESDNVDVKYTVGEAEPNSQWAPVKVTITEPIVASFEYPAEYGTPKLEGSSSCDGPESPQKSVLVEFSNFNTTISFYKCGFGGGGYTRINSYVLTTNDGNKFQVNENEYMDEDGEISDVHYFDAVYNYPSDESWKLYVQADLPIDGLEDYKEDFNLMLESLVLE